MRGPVAQLAARLAGSQKVTGSTPVRSTMLKQAHLFIKGDVVGVGFRAWTKIQAKPLDVTGWIRNVFNRPDLFGKSGGVETVIQGEEDEVKSIIKLIKQGPPVSRVDDVEIVFEDPREIFDIFEIRRSESY